MNAVSTIRKPINISIDPALVRDARELGINISRAAEAGLRSAIKVEKVRRWQEENRAAIDASNAWVAEHGLPLEKYRMF